MNITTQKNIVIRDDWQTNYAFVDDVKARAVVVTIAPRAKADAVPALKKPPTPAKAAVTPADRFSFILWKDAAYDAANALNDGQGYGNSDLISAIASYLSSLG